MIKDEDVVFPYVNLSFPTIGRICSLGYCLALDKLSSGTSKPVVVESEPLLATANKSEDSKPSGIDGQKSGPT